MPSQNFSFTGAEELFVVPAGVTSMTFDVAGAQAGNGGAGGGITARLGGRVQGTLTTTPGATLRIRVGRAGIVGGSADNAFFGGKPSGGANAGSGGGASDIRTAVAETSRVVVGGGAGGPGTIAAGAGGIGGATLDTEATAASDATAGSGAPSAGGGGGGWRGGLGGAGTNQTGNGGTSMRHSTLTSAVTSTPDFQAGDGYVTLEWSVAGTTTARRFYGTTVADDQTFTGEATIRGFDEAAPANNTATTVTWTTTTITEKTLIPGAANAAAGNTSQNNGFAFRNASGASNLSSTATQNRWIKEGAWNFSVQMTLNTAALLDTHALTLTARAYRVPAGGGARTLLFTATSANVTASATVTWSSAAQPEYVLAAGEVVMVGITATSASTTALVLGANTNTVLTITLGSSTYVEVPTPGIRTLSIGAYSAFGATTPEFIQTNIFSALYTATAAATVAAIGASTGSGVYSASASATVTAVGASRFAGTFTAAGSSTAQAIATSIFSGVFTASGVATTLGRITNTFSAVFEATGVATTVGRITNIFSGVFAALAAATSDWRISAVAGTVFSASGAATTVGRVTNIFSGVFAASGVATTLGRVTSIFSGVYTALAIAIGAYRGTGITAGTFIAIGDSDTLFRASSLAGTVFATTGLATPNIRASRVQASVFAANVSEGGGASEYPNGLLRLRPDGRIESVRANTGPLPSGTLRLVAFP